MALKLSDNEHLDHRDLSYVWRGWFHTTPEGRALLLSEGPSR
jgi:hypothetical protein